MKLLIVFTPISTSPNCKVQSGVRKIAEEELAPFATFTTYHINIIFIFWRAPKGLSLLTRFLHRPCQLQCRPSKFSPTSGGGMTTWTESWEITFSSFLGRVNPHTNPFVKVSLVSLLLSENKANQRSGFRLRAMALNWYRAAAATEIFFLPHSSFFSFFPRLFPPIAPVGQLG